MLFFFCSFLVCFVCVCVLCVCVCVCACFLLLFLVKIAVFSAILVLLFIKK